MHWTHFTAPSGSGSQEAVAVDTREGAVAFLINSETDMVQINGFPGAGPVKPGQQSGFGYLVVFPTSGIEAKDQRGL